jgi:hypothetical protein
MGIECFHELHGLFKLVARCYVYEFAVLKLLEHAIHGTSTSLLLGWLNSDGKILLLAACGCDGDHGPLCPGSYQADPARVVELGYWTSDAETGRVTPRAGTRRFPYSR